VKGAFDAAIAEGNDAQGARDFWRLLTQLAIKSHSLQSFPLRAVLAISPRGASCGRCSDVKERMERMYIISGIELSRGRGQKQ
jgi:hypothetical protein